MERPGLRVVPPGEAEGGAGRSARWVAPALAGCLLAGSAAATLAGADAARRTFDPRELVREVAVPAMTGGLDEPRVAATLRRLHARIRARPLDASTRVVYAALITAISRNADDAALARFHARAAAATAPVTVPVVRYAAHVLADLGDLDSALAECRRISTFDPDAAAELLARLEPYVLAERSINDGLGDRPAAWSAWVDRLRNLGRWEEANRWLERAHERWPRDEKLLERMALRLAAIEDWDGLRELLSGRAAGDGGEPDGPVMQALRALIDARSGETEAATAAVDRVLASAPSDVRVLTFAGDVALLAGDLRQARERWARALHVAQSRSYRGSEIDLLARLARLGERTGEASRAFRYWQRLLELSPNHDEARSRVRALGGGGAPP